MKASCSTWSRSVAMALALTIAAAPALAGEEAAVAKANEQFYAALNAMFEGNLAPMEAVWSHAGEVTYLPPDGTLLVGWEQVRASWQTQASMKLGGHVAPENVHVTVGSDLAAVCNFEKGANTNVKGKKETVSIRSSKVFRKENGAWKLLSDHADPLPFLQK
jgi:ketosteroid isomerase-like protein